MTMSPELRDLLRALAAWLQSITAEPCEEPELDGDDWFDAAERFDG